MIPYWDAGQEKAEEVTPGVKQQLSPPFKENKRTKLCAQQVFCFEPAVRGLHDRQEDPSPIPSKEQQRTCSRPFDLLLSPLLYFQPWPEKVNLWFLGFVRATCQIHGCNWGIASHSVGSLQRGHQRAWFHDPGRGAQDWLIFGCGILQRNQQ